MWERGETGHNIVEAYTRKLMIQRPPPTIKGRATIAADYGGTMATMNTKAIYQMATAPEGTAKGEAATCVREQATYVHKRINSQSRS